MYRLYIGYRPLGEFNSIMKAKDYAHESGLSGVFSLIGDNYRDTWYIGKNEKAK